MKNMPGLRRAAFGAAAAVYALFLLCGAAAAGTVRYEAEDGVFLGTNHIVEDDMASGGKAVAEFAQEEDAVIFEIDVPGDGYYDLGFSGRGSQSEKYNHVFLDGVQIGDIYSPGGGYGTDVLYKIYMTKGRHYVRVQESWGWFYLDSMTVTPTEAITDSVYEVSDTLSNPNATENTRALYSFLCENYGRYTIAGQFTEPGLNGEVMQAIRSVTGKYPALLGLDMANSTPSRIAFNPSITRDAVERAIEFDRAGGIVCMSWHWSAPPNTVFPEGQGESPIPWWHSYREKNSCFDLRRVVNGEDPEGKQALDGDIKAIAAELKRLEEAGVPLLWRPLHEASGGWFWWGGDGPEVFKNFWVYLYRQLTEVYHCNNLIWICNCENPAWYPGDEYVDIVSCDIYPERHQYASRSNDFVRLTEYPGRMKLASVTECGVVPDIEQCMRDNVHWSWFCSWNAEYVVKDGVYSPEYTEAEKLLAAYENESVLTLEDIRDMRPW